MPESLLPSIVDPRDYDRLRFIQMNGGTGNTFEETIHRVSNSFASAMPIPCQFEAPAYCKGAGLFVLLHLTVRVLLPSRAETERDGTGAETRFGFPAKRTSPFISAGVSVQSAAGSRGVRISGSNAG